MSHYKTITALLGGSDSSHLQETLLKPLQSLQEKTIAVTEANPTACNQKAKQSLEGMTERLMAFLAPANPLNIFKKS